MSKLLEVKTLVVEYRTDEDIIHAVNGVSFGVEEGMTLGIVGETGAGKTTTCKSILRLISDINGKIKEGEILYRGRDVLNMSHAELGKVRGNEIAMIFQDPMTALNPIMTIGKQIGEIIQHHEHCSKGETEIKVAQMLEKVGIDSERASDYPHQFSGGMKQRVVIALALACNPSLLLADEPTTALDVTIQAQILEMIKRLQEECQTAMILITHDLGIVAETCDNVCIMYAGEILEYGTVKHIFENALHPYTCGLFNAIPSVGKRVERLKVIPGLMPDPSDLPAGCKFCPRCDLAEGQCAERCPDYIEVEPGHFAKCFRYQQRKDG